MSARWHFIGWYRFHSPFGVHLNLINSKALGLEVLFRIISSLNYREVNIKIAMVKAPNIVHLSLFTSIGYNKQTWKFLYSQIN